MESGMSLAVPFIEVSSALVGILTAYIGTLSRSSGERKRPSPKSHEFLVELTHSDQWRDFEKNRLSEILKDNRVSTREWVELLNTLEVASREVHMSRPESTITGEFLTRPKRSKMLLASSILEELRQSSAA